MTTSPESKKHETGRSPVAGPSPVAGTAALGEVVRTIGVAIAVPDPDGGHLRQQRAAFGDPEAHRIPPHITLLPPTEVTPAQHDLVIAHLTEVAQRFGPFVVHLRGTATFRPVSPVVFVQLVAGIAECERLESAVRSGPLHRDLAFYYHPHVTVAHRLADDALDAAAVALEGFDCTFEVTDFLMYEHDEDGVWRPRRAFPFGSGDVPVPVARPAAAADGGVAGAESARASEL